MSNEEISLLVTIFTIFILFILQILMPKLTRKDIYFGVRIPENEVKNIELKEIYNKYVVSNIIFLIPYIAVSFLLLKYFAAYFEIWNVLLIIVYLIATFFIYFLANRKVKKVKNKFQWNKGKKAVVVIDTNFSKDKNKNILASPWWFVIPLIIIIINIAAGFSVYDKMPDVVATHFNFAGEADGWTRKSYKLIFEMPGIQLFLIIVMFFSYKIIGWSKQQISASNPEESKEKNKSFRYVWSLYIIVMSIVISILLTFGNLNIIGIIKVSSKASIIVTLIVTLAISISSIIISIKTGQGGSKIKIKTKSEYNNNIQERDDDKYWKLGSTIYVNKDDPAIFIEKRFGIGWTMNFGRIESIIIMIVFVILIIALPIALQ